MRKLWKSFRFGKMKIAPPLFNEAAVKINEKVPKIGEIEFKYHQKHDKKNHFNTHPFYRKSAICESSSQQIRMAGY